MSSIRRMNRITGTKTIALIFAVGLSAVLIGGINGCKKRKRMGGIQARIQAKKLAHMAEIEGIPITIGQFTAVDVVNPSGNVEIRAHDRHEKAYVEFKVRKEQWLRWRMAKQGIEFDPVGDYFTAEYFNPEGSLNQFGTLVVRPTDLSIGGFRPPVDLVISVPRCDGVRVSTSNGHVKITGVSGTIEIQNGDEFTRGGEIWIRSGNDPVEEITAFSSSGDIHFVASPANSGVFEISAPRGNASFNSRYGYVDHSMPERGKWTGIWNDGSNAITLHAEDGDATVFVTEKPQFYRP